MRCVDDTIFPFSCLAGRNADMASINFNEVQNKNELTADEGVKGDLISSTLGGKRPAPSAAEGGSSEDEVSPKSVTTPWTSAFPHSPCAVMIAREGKMPPTSHPGKRFISVCSTTLVVGARANSSQESSGIRHFDFTTYRSDKKKTRTMVKLPIPCNLS